ncbi:MAG: branched-chain amino acid ABC transporter permease [Chloroflexota bacterium]|nr:MAG: branched-chain amino acid ABC transporter permease [Chloroflexota bacterium]
MEEVAVKPFTQDLLRRWLSPAVIIVLVLLAGFVPWLVNRENVWNLLYLICLYITLGQSWNILAGFAGQTSLGHAAFFGIGALVVRTLWLGGVPFFLAFPLAGVAAVAFSLIIGVPTFRLRGAYFAIATLGVAEVLRIIVSQNLPMISTISAVQIANYNLPTRYYAMLGLTLATMVSAYLLLRSSLGLGILAVREDEEAARATGVSVLGHKLLALVMSSFFAGLAGSMFAFQQISYYPSAPFNPNWSFESVLVAYVGGLGSLIGPVIGAIFYIFVHEVLAIRLVNFHQVIFGLLFIVIVLLFPGGLMEAWNRIAILLKQIWKKVVSHRKPGGQPL